MSTTILVEALSSFSEGFPVIECPHHFDLGDTTQTSAHILEIALHSTHQLGVHHLLLEDSSGGELWHKNLMIHLSNILFDLGSPLSENWTPIMVS